MDRIKNTKLQNSLRCTYAIRRACLFIASILTEVDGFLFMAWAAGEIHVFVIIGASATATYILL